jgi:hypothetical protein
MEGGNEGSLILIPFPCCLAEARVNAVAKRADEGTICFSPVRSCKRKAHT